MEGEACSAWQPYPDDEPDYYVSDCAETMHCSPEGLCELPLPSGAACTHDDQCLESCGPDGTCEPREAFEYCGG